MAPSPISSGQHCFKADPQTLDPRNLSSLTRHGSLVLEEFGIVSIELALADMPATCPDFLEEGIYVVPTVDLGLQRDPDSKGVHTLRLSRLRPSAVSVFAALTPRDMEDFAEGWASPGMCDVFRLRKNVPAHVDGHTLRAQALKQFLLVFCPLCRQASAEGHGIYVLLEHHEYRT